MQAHLKELTSLIFDAIPQAVVVADLTGTILTRNASAESLLPEGTDISEVLVDGEGQAVVNWRDMLTELAEHAEGREHRNVSIAGQGGRRLLVDIHVRPLREEVALVVIQDISARVSMERRLAVTERLAAVGGLAASIAHELNNPLDGVLRYIGLAERDSGEKSARYLQEARSGLMRMADIIRGMLDSVGTSRPGREATPVDKLIEEAVDAMQPRTEALGVTVVCDLAEEASVTVPGSVFQVFCNIIKNALDAMSDGGALTIRLKKVRAKCVITFTDTGVGLEAEDTEKIFKPFYTTKLAGKGSGLGLAICREILARLGSTITARPGEEGGVVITVELPFSAGRGLKTG